MNSSRTSATPGTLRHLNTGLSFIVLLLAVYIMFAPFLPSMQFWGKKLLHDRPPLVTQNMSQAKGVTTKETMPADNTLVIPSINLQQVVYDGASASTLSKGVWHRPHTSSPDAGSNTVVVGHRFTYTNPEGVFYSLDKIHPGDTIVLYWQQKKYRYTVSRTFVVPPTAVEIEQPTKQPMLTLYTCTPLWSAHDRLVIQAERTE